MRRILLWKSNLIIKLMKHISHINVYFDRSGGAAPAAPQSYNQAPAAPPQNNYAPPTQYPPQQQQGGAQRHHYPQEYQVGFCE